MWVSTTPKVHNRRYSAGVKSSHPATCSISTLQSALYPEFCAQGSEVASLPSTNPPLQSSLACPVPSSFLHRQAQAERRLHKMQPRDRSPATSDSQSMYRRRCFHPSLLPPLHSHLVRRRVRSNTCSADALEMPCHVSLHIGSESCVERHELYVSWVAISAPHRDYGFRI